MRAPLLALLLLASASAGGCHSFFQRDFAIVDPVDPARRAEDARRVAVICSAVALVSRLAPTEPIAGEVPSGVELVCHYEGHGWLFAERQDDGLLWVRFSEFVPGPRECRYWRRAADRLEQALRAEFGERLRQLRVREASDRGGYGFRQPRLD